MRVEIMNMRKISLLDNYRQKLHENWLRQCFHIKMINGLGIPILTSRLSLPLIYIISIPKIYCYIQSLRQTNQWIYNNDNNFFDYKFLMIQQFGQSKQTLPQITQILILVQEIISQRVNQFIYNINQGDSLLNQNNYEEAIQCFDNAIKINPNNCLAFNNKGNALYQLNRFEEAIKCHDQALTINPNNCLAFNNKGNALYKLNRFEEAIKCDDNALKINPQDKEAQTKRLSALGILKKQQ
ncbi:unnamed protein product [Paramecium pentaurelia]|uniref:Tetratricopeptide repeat protein n=1 Tax=Paramecium pentaurelia TaxID=43138 RepID=A0A8S1X956_9CILI|nr:unnamed protein product [Paramecium pentaurelia]